MIDAAEAISEQRRDIGRFIYVAHLVELLVAFVPGIPLAIALALVNFLILRFLQTLKRSIP